jgi:cell division transport system permease protein
VIGLLLKLLWRGVRDVSLHPLAQLLTLVAVTMISLLAGAILLVFHSVDQELIKNRGQVRFQVFWAGETPEAEVRAQWAELARLDGLAAMDTYTPQQALAELSRTLEGDFAWLAGQNPLPYSAYLSFSLPSKDVPEGWAFGLLEKLKDLPGVRKVHFNPLQMELARGWLAVSQAVVWPIVGFLGLVVALVVGNTIRLSLLTRRDEVEILSLVGAKPWFIRLPLLAGGALQGLCGGGIALGLLKLGQHLVREALDVPPLFLRIEFLPWPQAAGLVAAVTLVGVASSFVAGRN